jgi:glycosyltransferase involved in cell wall biosynthesis
MAPNDIKSPAVSPARNAATLRREGDRLRDAGRFAEAAEVYERYLGLVPKDATIWVQCGNCLKDAGSYAMSRRCYEEALKLVPSDADTHLQLGHLHKLTGRTEMARASYVKANALDPALPGPAVELAALGVKPAPTKSPLAAPGAETRTALILDLTDLILFLKENAHLTGIQRVQVGIAFNLRTNQIDFDRIGSSRDLVLFAYCDKDRHEVLAMDPRQLTRLIDDILSKSLKRSEIDNRLNMLLGTAPIIKPRPGDFYVILGAYWLGAPYFQTLRLVKDSGCRIGVFIHDLIPLTHPQFVAEVTRNAMVEQLADILTLSDFVLTNSEYVAREVGQVLRVEMQTEKPVFVVPLSHELPEPRKSEATAPTFSLPKEYVLCVGTIEGRKNHLLLLNVWSSLYQKLGGAIPPLVIVGKWGWRVDEFRRELEARRYVDGRIIILDSVSDQILRNLYDNCLFTVFASFAEGWGLPVGESLASGKPCITSKATSLPEVGGDFCRYFEPYDPTAATAAIERAITDRKDLRRWTDRIRESFTVRRWSDVADLFFGRIVQALEVLAEAPMGAEPARITAGQVHVISLNALAGAAWSDRALKFVLRSGWWQLEAWGSWASRPLATLSFTATGARPGATVRVWLHLRLPPNLSNEVLTISDDSGHETLVRVQGAEPRWFPVDSEVEASGRVMIKIRRQGPSPTPIGNRTLHFGLSAIAYHLKGDVDTRLDLLEAIVTLPKNLS